MIKCNDKDFPEYDKEILNDCQQKSCAPHKLIRIGKKKWTLSYLKYDKIDMIKI